MVDMTEEVKGRLATYGQTVVEKGWKAGEPLINEGEKLFPEFRKWATAVGIMLRVQELVEGCPICGSHSVPCDCGSDDTDEGDDDDDDGVRK